MRRPPRHRSPWQGMTAAEPGALAVAGSAPSYGGPCVAWGPRPRTAAKGRAGARRHFRSPVLGGDWTLGKVIWVVDRGFAALRN
jgi:hypothetical protein